MGVMCDGALGLLPDEVARYPGKRSLKLGIPGLYYGRPLAFKAGMGWRPYSGGVVGRAINDALVFKVGI